MMECGNTLGAIFFPERFDKMMQYFIRIPSIFIIVFRQCDDEFSGLDTRSACAGSEETVTIFFRKFSPIFFRLSLIDRVKMLLFLAAAYIIYPSHKVRQLLMSNITCSSHICFSSCSCVTSARRRRPARRNTQSTNRQVCAMGIFRSQSARPLCLAVYRYASCTAREGVTVAPVRTLLTCTCMAPPTCSCMTPVLLLILFAIPLFKVSLYGV